MSNKNKTLYLLCFSFPFGKKEPLLNIEILYLAKAFDKIVILSADETDTAPVALPNNVSVIRYPARISGFKKLMGIFTCVFSIETWKEIKNIKKIYGLKFSIKLLKVLVSAFAEAKLFHKNISPLISNTSDDLYFYSWWCRYQTIGLAMLKKEFPSVKCYTRMHGFDLYFDRHSPKYLPFRSFIFDSFNAVFFISEQGKKYISEKFNKNFKQHFVAKLGVYNPFFLQEKNKSSSLNIVSCSVLIPLKRVHLIIEALAKIDFPVQWTHFGDGELMEKLKKLAEEKLPKNITYHFSGFMDNDKILSYYHQNKVDLFINVSETEGIPISIMEAFSSGIPAIATNVGGVSELVNESTGFLIDKKSNADQIANCIKLFHTLPSEQVDFLKKSAHQKWENEYNAVKNIQYCIDLMLSAKA